MEVDVCTEDDKTSASHSTLEVCYEVDNNNTHDGHVSSIYDDSNKEEEYLGKCEYGNKIENMIEEDGPHEPHVLTGNLKVSEDKTMTSMRHFDDMHALVT